MATNRIFSNAIEFTIKKIKAIIDMSNVNYLSIE